MRLLALNILRLVNTTECTYLNFKNKVTGLDRIAVSNVTSTIAKYKKNIK